MKKILKILIFIVICVILLNGIIYNDEKIIRNSVIIQDTSNALSIMIETEAGSGIYEENKTNDVDMENYVFDNKLSKCENGGHIFYDNEKNKIILKNSLSDKCYYYLDKRPSINNNLKISAILDYKIFEICNLSLNNNEKIKKVMLKVSINGNNEIIDIDYDYNKIYSSTLGYCIKTDAYENIFLKTNYGDLYNFEIYVISEENKKSFTLSGTEKIIGTQNSGGTDN